MSVERIDSAKPALDIARLQRFMQKVMGDLSGAMVSLSCAIGDRADLFRVMANGQPITTLELASRAGIDLRSAEQWLNVLVAAGYLFYDSASGSFSLPPEHAAVLLDGTSTTSIAGAFQLLLSFAKPIAQIIES